MRNRERDVSWKERGRPKSERVSSDENDEECKRNCRIPSEGLSMVKQREEANRDPAAYLEKDTINI